MADGYRYPQQSAGNYYFQTQPLHPRHQILRTITPPNNIRSFNTDTPSPSRSPDSHSPSQSLYGMYNQGQHQGQHGRVNGGLGRGGMPPMGGVYNFQHTNTQHGQHHSNLQQDHNAHNTNGSVLGHHPSYSGGLTSSTPSFTPQSLQNGHSGTTQGGQAQQITEHWAEQIKQHKAALDAHSAMIDHHAPNHYARIKAGENRGISSAASTTTISTEEVEYDTRGRPSNLDSNPYAKRQDWHSMDLSGQGIRSLAPSLFVYTFLTELYVPSNKLTQLPAAIGQLRALRHLDASNNQLKYLPPELGMCVYLKNLLLFDNQLTTLPNELGSLHQLDMLGIEGNRNLDPDIKTEIMERGTKSLIHQLRENAPVPLPPAPRAILDLSDGTSPSQDRFKVFSYNVLCEKAATPQQYGYTPSGALAWDFRKEQILQEIIAQDADIVCLQEVDSENFKEFFSVKLAYEDYRGVYWPRPRSKTMSEKDAKYVDGCATFFKGSKYILLDKQIIDIANIAINKPEMRNQHDIFNRVMPRDHIAVITFFENRQTGARFIVVNNHLFWDPQFADVKLVQIAIVMEFNKKEAEKYARMPACKDKKPYTIADDAISDAPVEASIEPAPSMEYTSATQIPMILCTDLNSTADSGVYELLSTGRVAPDHKELAKRSYGYFTRDGIEHPFSLRSAYTVLDGTSDALTFTNYTPGFQGVIDHIWYSTNTVEVTSLLSGVDQDYIKRVPGFPNYHFPSDHLSLVAEFSVKGRKEKKTHPEPDFGPSSSRNERSRRDRDS